MGQLISAKKASPATVDSILASCSPLSDADRLRLLEELSVQVQIKPWDDGTSIPDYTSPAPSQSSRAISLSTQIRRALPCEVIGCPWCRRPVSVLPASSSLPKALGSSRAGRFAFVALIYGTACHKYFFGALVLGWGLLKYAGGEAERVLMYTSDVPQQYVEALTAVGWSCREIHYLKSVARALFHDQQRSRFLEVFTKLRAMEMEEFEKVLCLDIDMLVRLPPERSELKPLDFLFSLDAPAAMKRGDPCPAHGAKVPYCELWAHPRRRAVDKIPAHQQASGINAGVMLFEPNAETVREMEVELLDWDHPEHYATYMPEQEYLTRFYGTFSLWTHISCAYNYEIDKNERIPHDFTESHKPIRAADTPLADGHPGAVILHYSGHGIKPWNLLFHKVESPEAENSWKRKWEETKEEIVVRDAAGVLCLRARLKSEGPDKYLDGYEDKSRLWAALTEWMEQLVGAVELVKKKGYDPIAIVVSAMESQSNEANGGYGSGSWSENGYYPKRSDDELCM